MQTKTHAMIDSHPAHGAGRTRRALHALVWMTLFILLVAVPMVRQILEGPLTEGTAFCVSNLLAIVGEDVVRSGGSVFSPAFSIVIDWRCTALYYAMALLAGLLARPMNWRTRVLALGGGLLALGILNLLRIVTIFLTGTYAPRSVPMVHDVVWEVLMFIGTISIYRVTMKWIAGRGVERRE